MKLTSATLASISTLFLCSSILQAETTDRVVSIAVGGTLLVSTDHYDFLEDNYFDVDAGGAFIGPQVRLDVRATETITLQAGLDLLAGTVEIDRADGTDDDYTETLIVPFAAIKIVIPSGKVDVFIRGEVNYNDPDTDSHDYDVDSGGVGGGGYVGVTFLDNIDVEVGYQYLPVEVQFTGTAKQDVDYGGVAVKGTWRF